MVIIPHCFWGASEGICFALISWNPHPHPVLSFGHPSMPTIVGWCYMPCGGRSCWTNGHTPAVLPPMRCDYFHTTTATSRALPVLSGRPPGWVAAGSEKGKNPRRMPAILMSGMDGSTHELLHPELVRPSVLHAPHQPWYVPSPPTGPRPMALVFLFHGFGTAINLRHVGQQGMYILPTYMTPDRGHGSPLFSLPLYRLISPAQLPGAGHKQNNQNCLVNRTSHVLLRTPVQYTVQNASHFTRQPIPPCIHQSAGRPS
ncbi:hypothetical protein BO71DRAFT_36409 [Aspergillus ellipticus CBS 707.79]|uniref:Uncharacterized protein n=1 Tax=Aspergillus ellipticus CBS 707.79 TaxID=1448320 RepID=A0A319DCE4_9EURO|nr:hypothetical protein BO71DRAFT_36409 [Aspergillus ellipticus CBS 707.79]